jgi:hypothetical protein
MEAVPSWDDFVRGISVHLLWIYNKYFGINNGFVDCVNSAVIHFIAAVSLFKIVFSENLLQGNLFCGVCLISQLGEIVYSYKQLQNLTEVCSLKLWNNIDIPLMTPLLYPNTCRLRCVELQGMLSFIVVFWFFPTVEYPVKRRLSSCLPQAFVLRNVICMYHLIQWSVVW